ncbi:uncharacterized protein APUU_41273S [Aspergillus puulaauensis]|uniref:Rhodopsin domain-containing protein n=1 Tax=Aspergillus puulaauensis TaxID=1220207 RepID=A0A7R7XP56_9EURO|nr:uncharacterized protein APUU_41273S [Aspergillus puulaauensis]BCS24829.1 hypothetical protein APUU_41273S [Aspergillus puulaauensis]
MTDPAILAAFGPPPANVNLAESSVRVNNGAVIGLLCASFVLVILRFIARLTLRNPLLADDWAIIAALCCIGATTGLSVSGSFVGAGRHVWAVSLDDLMKLYRFLFSYTFIYGAGCTCTRVSILFFYRRIFSPLEKPLKIALLFASFITIAYPLIIWITMANACKPLSFFWTQFSGKTNGKCININQFFLALGILNMLNDFIILALPFPRIIKLQMTLQKKVAICCIMAVGIFVCVASILRIHFLSLFMNTADVTYLMGPVFIWSTIEPSVAIVCACLPHLAPLARIATRSISSSFRSRRSTGKGTGTGTRGSGGRALESDHHHHHHKGGNILGNRGQPFQYGFNFNRLDSSKSKDQGLDDDEIGLTNYVTAGNDTASIAPDGRAVKGEITVKSSFVQSSTRDGL